MLVKGGPVVRASYMQVATNSILMVIPVFSLAISMAIYNDITKPKKRTKFELP